MNTVIRVTVGVLLLAAAAAFAAPGGNIGPPSQFPGNGNGPPHGSPHGNGTGGSSGSDGESGPSDVPDVHTVPEPSTLLLSIAALGIMAGLTSRRR